jgi:hypothetical protein
MGTIHKALAHFMIENPKYIQRRVFEWRAGGGPGESKSSVDASSELAQRLCQRYATQILQLRKSSQGAHQVAYARALEAAGKWEMWKRKAGSQ